MNVGFTATFMLWWLQNWGRRWVYSFYWSLYLTYFWLFTDENYRRSSQISFQTVLQNPHKSGRSTHTAVLVAQTSLNNRPIASTSRRGFSFCNEILPNLFCKPRNLLIAMNAKFKMSRKIKIRESRKNIKGYLCKKNHIWSFSKSHLLIRPF